MVVSAKFGCSPAGHRHAACVQTKAVAARSRRTVACVVCCTRSAYRGGGSAAFLRHKEWTREPQLVGTEALPAFGSGRIDPQFLPDMSEFGRVHETAIHHHRTQLGHAGIGKKQAREAVSGI